MNPIMGPQGVPASRPSDGFAWPRVRGDAVALRDDEPPRRNQPNEQRCANATCWCGPSYESRSLAGLDDAGVVERLLRSHPQDRIRPVLPYEPPEAHLDMLA